MPLFTCGNPLCKRTVIIVGISMLATGIGLTFLLQDLFLWRRRQQGYLEELLRQILMLKHEVNSMRRSGNVSVGKRAAPGLDNKNQSLLVPSQMDMGFLSSDDDDPFLDARSNFDSDLESLMNEALLSDDDMDLFNEFVENIDKLLKGSWKYKLNAYQLAEDNQWKFRGISEYQWRLAQSAYFKSLQENLTELERYEFVRIGLEAAQKSIRLCKDSSNGYKWLAILTGMIGTYGSNKEKLLNGFKYKEYIDKSIELNDTDPESHHFRGMWCYYVYNITWWERALATRLFGTPPTSTIEDALHSFEKCEELNPGASSNNGLHLAKCYIAAGHYTTAVSCLRKSLEMNQPQVPDDVKAMSEAKTLLDKYSSYAVEV